MAMAYRAQRGGSSIPIGMGEAAPPFEDEGGVSINPLNSGDPLIGTNNCISNLQDNKETNTVEPRCKEVRYNKTLL